MAMFDFRRGVGYPILKYDYNGSKYLEHVRYIHKHIYILLKYIYIYYWYLGRLWEWGICIYYIPPKLATLWLLRRQYIYLSIYLSITDIIWDLFENGVYDYSIYPQTLVTLWLLRRQILAYTIFSYIHLKTETRNHDSTGFWFQK